MLWLLLAAAAAWMLLLAALLIFSGRLAERIKLRRVANEAYVARVRIHDEYQRTRAAMDTIASRYRRERMGRSDYFR